MNNFKILKPVDRTTYFIGFLGFNAMTFFSIIYTNFYCSLVLGLIIIAWDYKRIKDISSNTFAVLLLVLPLMNLVFFLFYGGVSNVIDKVVLASGLEKITFASFFFLYPLYYLFLLFRKGKSI